MVRNKAIRSIFTEYEDHLLAEANLPERVGAGEQDGHVVKEQDVSRLPGGEQRRMSVGPGSGRCARVIDHASRRDRAQLRLRAAQLSRRRAAGSESKRDRLCLLNALRER